jgi:alpha-amylase
MDGRPTPPHSRLQTNRRAAACLLAVLGVVTLVSQVTPGEAHTPRRNLPRQAPPWQHAWSEGAVFYEIFVRSFADSDGDGIGDLKGLISHLDYLNDGDPATTSDLGVEAIWLMPVFASPSYHGYDTTDYETINPAYGTNADFATLCQEAHRRGIRVILDLVVNHSSSENPWFVSARSSPSSPKRDWYIWSPNDLGWRQPWNLYTGADTWHPNPSDGQWFYGVFWEGMPDLNFKNPAVRDEIKRLASLWLERGADGFRLDAARYLVENGAGALQQDQPQTHAFWRELSSHIRSVNPEATMVGENWAEAPIIASYYGSTATVPGGDELPMSFDFPLASAIIQSVASSSTSQIVTALGDVARLYPPGATDAPFLTNHDQVRLATQLGGSSARERSAAAILLTMPGSPFLYYGEEVGLANGSTSGDESKRTPMPWDATSGGGFTTGTPWFPFAAGRDTANVAAQTTSPGSLLSRYRDLIHVRSGSAALRRGGLRLLPATTGGNAVLAFLRSTDTEEVLVVHNLSDAWIAGAGPFDVRATSFTPLLVEPGMTAPGGSSGAVTVTLPPRAVGIWQLR